MRYKPSKGQLEDWISSGGSLRGIARDCGYSVKYISDLCEEYGLAKPRVGRPKGFKVSDKTKQRTSETLKRFYEGLK